MTYSNSDQTFFMSHILPVYKRATVWDDNLCLFVQCWLGPTNMYRFADSISKNFIVGSCSDGACSPRMYGTQPVLEIDMLHMLDNTGLQYGSPQPAKSGVLLDNSMFREQWWDYFVTKCPDLFHSPLPNSPKHVHDICSKSTAVHNSNPHYFPKWYLGRRTFFTNRRESSKGPSMKTYFTAMSTHVQIDKVVAYHHQAWPYEAEEWKIRPRLWPPASVVEQVLNHGYQVVPKLCSSTGDVDSPVEWHITFTLCERYLARQRTPVQKLVYLMAKTLFYTYLDLHDDGNPSIEYPSYALKTTMMWMMEQTPVDKWTDTNVPCLIHEFLSHLWVSADKGALKNYFMITANVLSNCTPNVLDKAKRQISLVLSDVNKFLQGTELYKCNILLYGYLISKGGTKAYEEVVYECQNMVMLKGILSAIDAVHEVRGTYQHIIEILERGTGEGLQAKGYLFDEEECFHILKAKLNLASAAYIRHKDSNLQYLKVQDLLSRYSLSIDQLLEDVFSFDQQLPDPNVTIVRLQLEWEDGKLTGALPTACCGDQARYFITSLLHTNEWKQKLFQEIRLFPGETDLIAVREGSELNVYKWASIEDLVVHNVQDLKDHETRWWIPKIYSLTHRDVPELQLMDYARMLYLLYVCDDKIDSGYKPKLGSIKKRYKKLYRINYVYHY